MTPTRRGTFVTSNAVSFKLSAHSSESRDSRALHRTTASCVTEKELCTGLGHDYRGSANHTASVSYPFYGFIVHLFLSRLQPVLFPFCRAVSVSDGTATNSILTSTTRRRFIPRPISCTLLVGFALVAPNMNKKGTRHHAHQRGLLSQCRLVGDVIRQRKPHAAVLSSFICDLYSRSLRR